MTVHATGGDTNVTYITPGLVDGPIESDPTPITLNKVYNFEVTPNGLFFASFDLSMHTTLPPVVTIGVSTILAHVTPILNHQIVNHTCGNVYLFLHEHSNLFCTDLKICTTQSNGRCLFEITPQAFADFTLMVVADGFPAQHSVTLGAFAPDCMRRYMICFYLTS